MLRVTCATKWHDRCIHCGRPLKICDVGVLTWQGQTVPNIDLWPRPLTSAFNLTHREGVHFCVQKFLSWLAGLVYFLYTLYAISLWYSYQEYLSIQNIPVFSGPRSPQNPRPKSAPGYSNIQYFTKHMTNWKYFLTSMKVYKNIPYIERNKTKN